MLVHYKPISYKFNVSYLCAGVYCGIDVVGILMFTCSNNYYEISLMFEEFLRC